MVISVNLLIEALHPCSLLGLHGTKSLDAFLDRRMGTEKVGKTAPRQRINDEKMRRGRIYILHGDLMGSRGQFLQCSSE
jgi:hypothetical protein